LPGFHELDPKNFLYIDLLELGQLGIASRFPIDWERGRDSDSEENF
jgi:hypothetical protein